ncbi:hypothetical protein AB0910_23920 [Streptomyces sp. NPDC047002]|uniref:hypothetical protein n=1 Tax=Streptomyces sp. NPDC047002 TaxID=3155475 RepID=UPI003453159D
MTGSGPVSGAAAGGGPEPERPVPHPGGTPHATAGPTAPRDVVSGARPLRHRRAATALGIACALLLGGIAAANTLHRPVRSEDARGPGRIRSVAYRGLTLPTAPGKHTFTLHVRITAAPGPSATVQDVRHPFTGLTTRSSPAAPFTVTERHPRDVALTITVRDCAAVPLDVRLPFLDVTLRYRNDMQHHTEVLDRAYATDITAALRDLCRATAA